MRRHSLRDVLRFFSALCPGVIDTEDGVNIGTGRPQFPLIVLEILQYSVNHEKGLRVFLENGSVPIDNSASERSIRPFTTGRKNWVLINSIKGAQASAVAYSLVETAKLNGLNPYYYLDYLLTELPKLADEEGNIDTAKLDPLLPWSDSLPQKCYKPRR